MDVRCEKCQTEYELDEARLKPGGVTVKCTHCGHTFKVRKRTTTNVGTPVDPIHERARSGSSKQPLSAPIAMGGPLPKPRHDSILDDDRPFAGDEAPTTIAERDDEAPTTIDRQWLIRLENAEQKSCRELATLQQWIISGVVTRESMISRTGKTWKRLGDIPDLAQYFTIADEARATRASKPSRPAPTPPAPAPVAPTPVAPAPAPVAVKDVPGTIPGYPQAAGGTILPDDDEGEARTTRAYRGAAPTPPPLPVRATVRTPPLGSPPVASPSSSTEPTLSGPTRSGAVTPPPTPPKRPPVPGSSTGPMPPVPPAGATSKPPAPPDGSRATAMWATDGVKPEGGASSTQPFIGKLSAVPDEPAFAGRVRMQPGAEASFESGRVVLEDDDDVFPARRSSRTGTVVLVMALLVMGAAAAAVYMFVIRDSGPPVATAPKDAAVPEPDATAVAAVVPDGGAPVEPVASLDAVRGDLIADLEPRLRAAIQTLDGKADAASQALRAHAIAQLAQDLQDRASVTTDKAAAEAARKESRQLVLDAATAAQRALKTAGDDPGANLAMAEVLRLQGKPVREIQRYLDTAKGKADKAWARELALAEAIALARDNKLDDARAAFAALDQGDGKLEVSNDVRARFHLALVLAAQDKAADAKPLVDQILAAQPEHLGAKALAGKLETAVAKSDPLPPEDSDKPAGDKPAGDKPAGDKPDKANKPDKPANDKPANNGGATKPPVVAGNSYDQLLQAANRLAESSCTRAMELYAKALEQKPNGVEALTGMGYCYVDAKQFSSAFSKFRTALVVSPRYEPALRGVAEGYLQQGLKDRAIEAYRTYLEAYPDSASAKKQLDRLTGGSTPPPPPANDKPSEPAPAPSEPAAGSGE